MSPKRPLLVAACVGLLFSVTGCLPGQSSEDPYADFFVDTAGPGQAGMEVYRPRGYGWKPNSKVEFSIWNEPDGRGSASTQWKKIFDVNVDATGMFGFNDAAAVYPVRRSICGNPETQQTMVFMARSPTTGTVRMHQSPVDHYFTLRPCP